MQFEDIKLPGYIPPNVAMKGANDMRCQRCFQLQHYGFSSAVTLPQPSAAEIAEIFAGKRHNLEQHLDWIGKSFPKTAICVKVVDIFNLQQTMIPKLASALGSRRVIIAVNKCDVLPSNWHMSRIEEYVRRTARQHGLRNIVAVVPVSAKGGHPGIGPLVNAISAHRKGRDVYMVGATNVGKSTLFNRFQTIASRAGHRPARSPKVATESALPGTTLAPVKVRIGSGNKRWHVHDTPGIVVNDRLDGLLFSSDEVRKHILPSSKLRGPKAHVMKNGTSLWIGSLGRVDVDVAGETGPADRILLLWYGALSTHQRRSEGGAEFFAKKFGGMLKPFHPAASEQFQAPLLVGTIWDLIPDNLRRDYMRVSSRVSRQQNFSGPRRSCIADVDLGGIGWLTLACAYRDNYPVERRKNLLQRTTLTFWGHSSLKASFRPTIMPRDASSSWGKLQQRQTGQQGRRRSN